MVNYRSAVLFAPFQLLYKSRSALLISSVAYIAVPGCAVYADGDKKRDDEDGGKEGTSAKDFFRNLARNVEGKKLPVSLDGLNEILAGGASTLKGVFESGVPAQVGYGFMMGYSSGFCLKKISRFLAFGLGGLFIAVQSLSYNGYIKVDYKGIQKDVEKLLDINKDGKVDENDATAALDKIKDVLEYNMPSGGGFTAGLFCGLRA